MAGEKAQPIFDNVYELFPGCLDPSPVADVQKATEPPKRPVDPDNWRLSGNCRTATPDLFIDQDDDSVAAAKAICDLCVVRVKCLYDALETRAAGTRGGHSQRERQKILRERRRMNR